MKQDIQLLKSVLTFWHDEESSTIDSYSRKIVAVDNEKYVWRVWLVKTMKEQYKIFVQSENIKSFKQQYPTLRTPSRSFFQNNRCACVSYRVMQSYVGIHTFVVMHYIR